MVLFKYRSDPKFLLQIGINDEEQLFSRLYWVIQYGRAVTATIMAATVRVYIISTMKSELDYNCSRAV